MTYLEVEMTDVDLLRRLRLRDRQAWAELARCHGPSLMRASYLFLGDQAAAEDVTQETLIAAWDAMPRAADSLRLRPWLLGILFNQCRMYRRSLWRRLRRERAVTEQDEAGCRAQDKNIDQLDALRQAIRKLDADHRMIVILRYEQELDVAQAAAVLGIPEGTVKSRTHAAIAKLKGWLEQQS